MTSQVTSLKVLCAAQFDKLSCFWIYKPLNQFFLSPNDKGSNL